MITLISCENNEGIFTPTEKQIQGQWEFEKVTFQKDLSLSFDDITDEYNSILLDFSNDGSFKQTNSENIQSVEGNWDISGYYIHYGESGQYFEKLKCYTINISDGQEIVFEWDNFSVSKNEITCSEHSNGGYYRYTLVKR